MDKSIEVDGYSGFVFTAKSGRPLMPNGVNSVLYNIVDAYNKTEVERAKKYGVKRLTPKKKNWCQNGKNHNFRRNKGLQTIDFKRFAKK